MAVTPNRKTHILLDTPEYSLIEPAFSKIRERDQIAAGSQGLRQNVKLNTVGWQLDAVQDDLGSERQSIQGQDGIFSVGSGILKVPSPFIERDTWKKQPSINYGPDTVDTGDPYFQKQVPSGGDENSATYRLDSDATEFPGPGKLLDLSPVDRVAATVEADLNETKVWRVKVIHNSALPTTHSSIFNFYFNAPASSVKNFVGFGQYCLAVYGDGVGWLLERGEIWDPVGEAKSTGWHLHRKMRLWSAGHQSIIQIVEVQTFVDGLYSAMPHGAIEVRTPGGAQSERNTAPGLMTSFSAPNSGSITSSAAGQTKVTFFVPRAPHGHVTSETVGAVKPTQNRLDLARESRAAAQIRRLTYVAEGVLRDDPFSLDCFPVTDKPITIRFWGEIPSGTTLTVKLYNSTTGDELTASESGTFYKVFPIPLDADYLKEGYRHYHVEFTLTSADGVRTPTLVGYQALRDGTTRLITPGSFEVDNPAYKSGATIVGTRSLGSEVSISNPEADLSTFSTSFTVDDITEILPRLKTRGLIGGRIETEYDPLDASKRSVLARFRIVAPKGIRKGRGTGYGSLWRKYDLDGVGFWQRMSEQLSTLQINWADADPEDPLGRPYKVTDAVRKSLGYVGLPDSMIDVPDLPLRFWSNRSRDSQVDPLANWGDLIMLWVRQWLGMRLIWDDNAGPYGMARVRFANRAPYNYFCHFVTTGPGAGKAVEMMASYGVDGSDGRPIVPIRAGTLTTWKKPLEFNKLVLTTTGLVSGGDDSRFKVNQVFYNFNSYNFLDLPDTHPNYPDPDHPDYWPGVIPAYVVDPTLGGDSEEVANIVNWFGRRMMAVAGNTKAGLRFQAGLPLELEVDDALSTVPRPPHFYDAVTVDGVPFLIRTCNPRYKKDKYMFADYELEAPREDFL